MATTKISALPGASTLTGAETIPVVQGGVTKKVTTDQFLIKDASGNVGVGVTPSAWLSGCRALDISAYSSFGDIGGATAIANNAYRNSGGGWVYKNTNAASYMGTDTGSFYWYTAASGTAGNPLSWTQAMTLDASGDFTTANGRINLITVGRGGGGVASNTASGYQALYSNTTGYNNTASGLQALYSNTTGAANTASGPYALYANTTGYNNTASGLSSGLNPDNDIAQYRITTDFDMTLVGYGATKDNAGQLWNSTAIGARAKVTKSNQVVLGDSNVTETLVNGSLVQRVSTTAATLDTNGTLTFSVVNDTTLRISVRGSDGTTRTATVALA